MQPIKHTLVYDKNADAYVKGYRYIINQGSARSSKTYSINQLLFDIANKPKQRTISIVSQTLPHLKRGAMRDFLNYLIETGQFESERWSKGNYIYRTDSSIIEFFSVDQPDKVYGAARDILFCNEVNSINEESFRQLCVRTREKIFVDYNPTRDFYITEDYKHRENSKYIHSTYKDNKYLHEEIIKELLEAGKRNTNFQKVFVEGEVGELDGAVFQNWEIGEFDKTLQIIYGQDYGFSKDPTTLIKIAIDEKKKIIYAEECFFKQSLSTDQIYELNKNYAGKSLIIGDSSEPRLIEELKKKGLSIRGAEKGIGSVSAGISIIQDYKIIVTENSLNLQKELKNYVWLDKGSKLVIDDFNHGIDAIRYAVMAIKNKHEFKGHRPI